MSHLTIDKPEQLKSLIGRLEKSSWAAIDTEFISESRYAAELCLVQIAYEDEIALIDPLHMRTDDLAKFWTVLCDNVGEVIVHACRSEMEFCFRSIGRLPKRFFDVQLAAGFVGVAYPAAYRDLLERVLHVRLEKSETRTNWKQRPLSPLQIDYALDDVRHLRQMADILQKRLRELKRLEWYYDENAAVSKYLITSFSEPKWRSLARSGGMKPLELAIMRDLFMLRDGVARRLNKVPGWILRDDLIVELARRATADPKRVASIRGVTEKHQLFREIVDTIARTINAPPTSYPQPSRNLSYPKYDAIVQFLYAALTSLSLTEGVHYQIVGSQSDVRDMVAATLGTLPEGVTPRLLHGWRAELAGELLHDLLNGKTAIRLTSENPDSPVELIPVKDDGNFGI
ncbi:MAG: HRDC domain-containing protein [Planctomycetaceae bacterium]|jgi:ribonuclease D|nr:HRDC domain-containing protein [Planctomycetaceae bacterium]